MSPAVAARVRQLAVVQDHRRAVAEFRRCRVADRQSRADALILEAVASLAALLGAPKSMLCSGCRRALSPRTRNCPHCRAECPPPEQAMPEEDAA